MLSEDSQTPVECYYNISMASSRVALYCATCVNWKILKSVFQTNAEPRLHHVVMSVRSVMLYMVDLPSDLTVMGMIL